MRRMLVVIDRIEFKYFEFNQLVTNFWMVKGLLENNIETYITTIDLLSLKQGKARLALKLMKKIMIFFIIKTEKIFV